jgi:flavin reductase (DIM6/NTAB) family NADH-FMN oxidoreductase RutF/DNA-binding MarR family transcriptional regulator
VTAADGSALLHGGDPAGDLSAFRQALGQFATGVTVVSAKGEAGPFAVTANSFQSVSLEPPLVLWSLRRQSGRIAAFLQADRFAINVLAADQTELAGHFARSGGDRFAACDWTQGLGRVPLLGGAAAHFECAKVAEHDGGDHVIFIGKVERYACFDRSGLIFAQGRYALAISHPGRPADLQIDGHPRDDFFLPLLARAYAYLAGAFSEHHSAEGVTTAESRVLAFLATGSGASAEVVAARTFLGQNTVQDALAKLIAGGHVAPRPPGALVITGQGLALLGRIIARARSFETEKLADLPAEDVAATRRVLRELASRGGG